MNFEPTEEQAAFRDLARRIFGDHATPERAKSVEATGGFDRPLWRRLCQAGIVAPAATEGLDGRRLGMVELALSLFEQGRTTAIVPLWTCGVAAQVVERFGTDDQKSSLLAGLADGNRIATAALAEHGANDPLRPSVRASLSGGRVSLRGTRLAVPYAGFADVVLVPVSFGATSGIAIVDLAASGASVTPVTVTNREPHGHLDLDLELPETAILGLSAGDSTGLDRGEALECLFQHSIVALAAIETGVVEAAVSMAASHISTRTQFGAPLAAFQATTQQVADGFITTEAMRVTVLGAAWRLAAGLDARRETLVAAWWAGEGAQVVTSMQHLHGGIGADVTYPAHRHFLWGIQLPGLLGSPSAHLSRLGDLIAGDAP